MSQMISYDGEMIRINSDQNHIEYSTNSGRTWLPRCTSSSCGTFLSLTDGGNELLVQTSKGLYYSTSNGRTWLKRN